ncbi:hypothetical protein A3C20_04845 [Candidatus Kaiserbacteria bacterium RIFCSPHIGHO2_02_FULL_55_25]|uniref:Uncharacterized protein n=1 Tax=Candidatus Kaiserbacteria bacterium RIFCSPHIGHO2_02_FULL_55_25 TaxID=1798498 RepID=A0A1F6EAY7_9BACT|nr:MAG: hypothetical protein A3C20_04845 [Candidatus Kaiserbacteria bacterium RIFCSPHIGHO2_02_FULL_55_25]OGG77157.1 MAG: hypothetical protein A3F56_04695 [Candidatus Kaiserbacteria bacterium RIFCSPHIGHO2_12_FULL_55_13]OGG83463.1 MAG: hypothetical protein A3A42_04220 [Candidatus Kaiserbacteria bacterium RIFCSPLOWO2_01_FULL_55_25]
MVTAAVIGAVSLIAAGFTFIQANQEQVDLTARLQSRAQLLADSLAESITPSVRNASTSSVQRIVDKFATQERIEGLGVFDASASPIAISRDIPQAAASSSLIALVMDENESAGAFVLGDGQSMYVFAEPLTSDDRVIGALVVVQNAQYIQDRLWIIWRDNLVRLLLQIIIVTSAIFVLVRWVFFRPLTRLVDSLKSVRAGVRTETDGAVHAFLRPLTSELSKMTSSLRQARTAASEEARLRLQKIDSPWTAERLREFIKAYLKDRPIFVVSNAEPYVHTKVRNKIEWSVPAGGVITAIEPVMEACGGTWIACGSGNADKETADKDGKIRVPPDEPKYTLKRVWITPKERKGYYDGLSNQALWPLCHLAHVRPQFRKEDWAEYRKVNVLFAKSLLEEIRHIERPIILVQDYHLALAPALIKKSRPDAQVAIFWHIPWPSAAQFAICPWRKEILEGMLGADLVGFHTQQYCNNFMDTVASEIEARIDYERFSVFRGGHQSRVEPFPISIAFPGNAEPDSPADRSMIESLGIRTEYLALGVDRLDYIKGIPERLRGIEFLLDSHPEYRGKLTFLQIASPTRGGIEQFQEYAQLVISEAERINTKFATRDWKPVVLEHRSYSHKELRVLYQLANVCLVTSLHDGMNLVAKEYVAARTEEGGVLVLSHFAGASRDLPTALVINPYSAEETAEAIHKALTMPESEQHRRMKSMRQSVREYNIYRWSAEIIKTLAGV